MLAHKATHEAKTAAEVIAGLPALFDPMTIPSVAYTDPEVAWMGLTETEAKEKGIAYEKGVFPWAASGRSLAIGRDEGITKLLFDPEDDRRSCPDCHRGLARAVSAYRNCWYQPGYDGDPFCCIGIHGQWLYVDPSRNVTIAKLSSQPTPGDDPLDQRCLAFFRAVSEAL